MQRVSDSWRSTMGSTAIAVVLAFCNENPELKDSDENRQEFATQYLEHLRFLYQKADGDDTNVTSISILLFVNSMRHFTEIQGSFPRPLHFANLRFPSRLR
jgi:hypothetical protein